MVNDERVRSKIHGDHGTAPGMWSTIKTMSTPWERNDTAGTQLTKLRKAIEMDLEALYTAIFGPCSTGDSTANIPAGGNVNLSELYIREAKASMPASPSREKEEFFYSQFLQNDHQRAVQAVHSLQQAIPSKNTVIPSTPDRSIPKLFPASSPTRRSNVIMVPTAVSETISCPASPVKLPVLSNLSFDDGISAISAHTLDEMFRNNELAKSRALGPVRSDLTSEGFGHVIGDISTDESILRSHSMSSRQGVHKNPSLSKNRSFGSHRSKGNRSMQTKSTQSSNSSHFESVWRKDEQKYWQNVVEEGDDTANPRGQQLQPNEFGVRTRSRESDCQKMYRHDGTNTTMNSSVHSSLSRQHPHETFPMHASDFVSRRSTHSGCYDPDRIQHALVLDHDTEIGEI